MDEYLQDSGDVTREKHMRGQPEPYNGASYTSLGLVNTPLLLRALIITLHQ